MDIRSLVIIGATIVLACAGNIEPGTAKQAMRNRQLNRMYFECIQQPAQFPSARNSYCRRLVRLQQMIWEWEDCKNEGTHACPPRPTWDDVH